MKYFISILILLPSLYTFSYAKSVWKKKNRFPAVGAALLAIASIVFPIILLFSRYR